MTRKPWTEFTGIVSHSFVRDLTPSALDVSPDDLVDMREYRCEERMAACAGNDPIAVIVTYAQDALVYAGNRIISADPATYRATPRAGRVNKFGLAYRRDAKLYLHKAMADITVGAAIHLWRAQGWTMALYDGLRTVDGAYNLYLQAADSDMRDGLLSLPGRSSHNKGMAIDSMMVGRDGGEIDLGAHFDHLDMSVNSRTYDGPLISAEARKNRLIREAAFLRSAFSLGLLAAPLRSEFWHDQLPENREDLWRVLESAARCLNIRLLSEADEILRRENRAAFEEKWERWSYTDFLARWQELFNGHEKELQEIVGAAMPPLHEKPECYHGNYHPVYDDALRSSGKHITERLVQAVG